MNIQYFSSLIVFITLTLCQSSLAQSINVLDAQKLLIENPSILENIPAKTKNQNYNQMLTSENQSVVNSADTPQLDLTIPTIQNTTNSQSLSNRYFKALTGQSLNIYGSKEFNQAQKNNLLFFNTIGKNYQLAPGDTIDVIISGLNSLNNRYQVASDGTIVLDKIYPLNVNNLTLDQVSKLVLDKIMLDDASAEVLVRLNTARLITVQISGNVNSPRTIAVPAYTPLSRVIAYSGGISESGSLRNISLNQIGELTQKVDFYNFLQNASLKHDPLIKNGARIFVPSKGPTVAVTGLVNNPGIYELPINKPDISIKNLLSVTGTSFLPSGAELKVSYFGSNGQMATRLATKNDSLKEGEALHIGFIETRDLNISKVSGAVLKDFEIKTNTPLSISEVIKDGSVLSLDAYKPFALIVGKEVQAINIDEVLEDDSITLPIGSDLLLFTKEEYLGLVASDPNKSLDPLISKVVKSNVAEIYLNGERIAYVPVNKDNELSESLRGFYNPSANTVYDLALIENNEGIKAFNLRLAINKYNHSNQHHAKLKKGNRLFIFEDKFFNDLILGQQNNAYYDVIELEETDNTGENNSSLETLKLRQKLKDKNQQYSEFVNYTRKILQRSNIVNINLNEELFSILPYTEGMTSSDVINNFRGRLPDLINEFVIIKNRNTNSTPQIKNLKYEFEIKKNQDITFINKNTYLKIITNYNASVRAPLINDIRESDGVRVYYDNKLHSVLAPKNAVSNYKTLNKIINTNEFYKLYIGLSSKRNNDKSWALSSYDASTFFSKTQNIILDDSNEVNFFSKQFIREKFINSLDSKNLLKDEDDRLINNNVSAEIEDEKTKPNSLNQINSEILKDKNKNSELRKQNNKRSAYVTKSMESNLRFISGSVMYPGTYPVTKMIKLRDLVEAAGLISSKASNVIVSKASNENGMLIKSTPDIYELNNLMENETVLSGEYYVYVPKVVNTAVSGFINLSGEFLKPGDYAFSEAETLSEIIVQAGGLSDTAYPLGAVLERESIRAQEKESNNILATQLEASVLTLAQSDIDGVGEQIKAVLGYAQQLRNLPTTGRMTINIMDTNNNLYLQDGDKLMIPRRPSHVSVIGAVQRTTVASYNQNKNFKDYIVLAGGLTKMADIGKAYLLLPNGESRLLDNNTIIPVGSVVVIPPKIDKLSILGLTDIVSRVMGNIATSILAINNVN